MINISDIKIDSPHSCIAPNISGVPSKKEAQDMFWGLKSEFWKQIIDGKFHEFGPDVFDKGLHGRVIEEGFFSSLKNGCEFASEHLTEKINITFYKDLHKILCAHFKGSINHTEMDSKDAGRFRDKYSKCRLGIDTYSKESKKHYSIIDSMKYYQWCEKNQTPIQDPADYERVCKAFESSKKWVEEWDQQWEKRTEETAKYMEDSGFSPHIAGIGKTDKLVGVHYNCIYTAIDKNVDFLFNDYNETN